MTTRIVHCKRDKYDVYIGRPSKWGNPFIIGKDGTREEVISKYEDWLLGVIKAPDNTLRPSLSHAKTELKDKILGCWCSPKACHGNILKRFVDNNKEKVDGKV